MNFAIKIKVVEKVKLYRNSWISAQSGLWESSCEKKNDFVTSEMFKKILEDTEEHIDWIESQQHLIENAGLKNYLQEQILEIKKD